MKFALIQMPTTKVKQENLQIALEYIARAAAAGARVAILPEMFCCPYSNAAFPVFAETADGMLCTALARAAKENHLTLVAGSIPERCGDKLYNTSFVFDENGRQIARHRKIHLFDAYIDGGQHFRESAVLSAGWEPTTFLVDGIRIGLCICFDIRFPELFRTMALEGAQAVIVPAAFNMTTGPLHWELSFRMRAVDNQLFTLGVAPARDTSRSYVSYANSIVCSPWGTPIANAGIDPNLLLVDIDFNEVAQVRRQLPLLSARRPDVYRS
jgi:predicted amidohydrolase